jgi:Putative transposase
MSASKTSRVNPWWQENSELTDARAFTNSEWVVDSRCPFGGPKQVLRYLARYTHRVAISNRRLIALDDKLSP